MNYGGPYFLEFDYVIAHKDALAYYIEDVKPEVQAFIKVTV